MKVAEQLAKHLRDLHFGGNWTAASLKDVLADVTWEMAADKVDSFHTIAELVFHMNYFIAITIKVLEGGPLEGKDAVSFDVHQIKSENDWTALTDKTWADAEKMASLVEQLPDSKLWEPFVEAKYGTWYRAIQGPIEHCHYHLGQIALIKKLHG
jgi:uncharacterized damage-inducible protein DinB